MSEVPLEGIRIVDLTGMLAGPYATRLLADMGAEVIKVESLGRYDLTRGPVRGDARARVYPDAEPGERPLNRSSYFNEMNRNKRGITIDLQTDRGRALFIELVKASDAVIENFSAGVMDRLGIGYEVLSAHKPSLVVVSMPAFGNSGPWRDAVAYGNTMEMVSGMASINGYPDSLPITSSFTYGDPVAGVHAAFGLLAALEHRDRTGEGQFVDVSQLETLLQFIGPEIVGYAMNGTLPERRGNRSPGAAPGGVWSTADGRWLAVEVFTDSEWAALCSVMDRSDLLDDERLRTVEDRLVHRDVLDDAVRSWLSGQNGDEAMTSLQRAGVPAGLVLDAPHISSDPQFEALGYLETVDHPDAGTHRYPGLPWRMTGLDRAIRSPAPKLGEHNREVFVRLLGLTDAEIDALEHAGIVGDTPSA